MSDELTGWYPANVRPVRKGVYDAADGKRFIGVWFKHWNGRYWGHGASSIDGAYSNANDGGYTAQYHFKWRGLARKP